MSVKYTPQPDGKVSLSWDDWDDGGDPYEQERSAAFRIRTREAVDVMRRTQNDLRPVLLLLHYLSAPSAATSDRIRPHLRGGVEIPAYEEAYCYLLPRKGARRALVSAGWTRAQAREVFTSMVLPQAFYVAVVFHGGLAVSEAPLRPASTAA